MNDILSKVGILALLYISFKVLRGLYQFLHVYVIRSYPDFTKYGKWAVITGSTDGIGKALAFQLASRGMNIVLVARNNEKLEAVKSQIVSKNGVAVKIIQVDFGESEEIYGKVEETLKDMDIGVLVNNVGSNRGLLEHFTEHPDISAKIQETTRINIMPLVKMTQFILPGMSERKRGLIINLSSSATVTPMATLALYGASKAFADYFSTALSYEYENRGITIQNCLPGLVSTKMAKDPDVNIFVPTPEDYAESLLSTVGKQRTTHGWWPHELQLWIIRFIPYKFYNQVVMARYRKSVLSKEKNN